MADHVGQRLGNYRLIRLVGGGSFAEVYLGEHVRLGSQAAIKVLSAHLTGRDGERFQQEATLIARLKHPHITRLLDFDVQGGIPFLVMEYAPNGSLRSRHPAGTRLALGVVVSHVKQVADALHYAHEQRLVHRDVKPENMLLGAQNEVLLSDFGIALLAQSTSYTGTQEVAGTVAYMAPEQAQGHPHPASDQYALGVVVYEWLCGERPFHGSVMEVAMQHQLTMPAPLHTRVPGLSPAVSEVVATALAKTPKDRFASVRDFAAALEHAVTQQHQYPVSTGRQTRQEQRPPPLPAFTVPEAGFATPSPAPFPGAGSSSSAKSQPTLVPSDPLSTPAVAPAQPPGQRRGLSRRTVLAGLAGVAVGAGGLTGLLLSRADLVPGRVNGGPAAPHSTATNPLSSPSSTLPPGHLLWRFRTGGAVENPAAFADGAVFVVSFDNFLYALDARQGSRLWSFSTPKGNHTYSAVAVADATVYFGGDDYQLYAFQAANGNILWKFPTLGLFTGHMAVGTDVLYVGSTDTYLYAINRSDGSLRWRFQTAGPIHSWPLLDNEVVYVGSADHYLYALRASDGSRLWRFQVGDQVQPPQIANGVIYFCSLDASIYAINASDGSLIWSQATGGPIYGQPAVDHDTVYVGSDDGVFYAFNANGGEVRWRFHPLGSSQHPHYIHSSPVVVNETIYFGAWDQNIYAVNTNDGSLVWHYPTGDIIESSPVVGVDALYLGSVDGYLYALTL